MSQSKLIELSYFDPAQSVRLTVYADTIILDRDGKEQIISAPDSKVKVVVIPTDEELMIASDTTHYKVVITAQ